MTQVKSLDNARLRRVFAAAIDTFEQVIPHIGCPERRERLQTRLDNTKRKLEQLPCE